MSCKGCEKRYVGCHDNCEEYREFRRKLDEQKEVERQARLQTLRSNAQQKRIERYQKRYGK